MKVSQFYNKNQFLIEDGERYFLQSYDSVVACINMAGVLILGRDWDYSKTTLKHLYLFINDYFFKISKDQQKHLFNFNEWKNKKEHIQKLIDKKIIVFSPSL